MMILSFLGIGLLGILTQMLSKILSLQKKTQNIEFEFTPKLFFKKEWVSISLSIVVQIAAAFILQQIITSNFQSSNKYFMIATKLTYLVSYLVGILGQQFVYKYTNVLDRRLNKWIDNKINNCEEKTE